MGAHRNRVFTTQDGEAFTDHCPPSGKVSMGSRERW